MDLHKSLRAAFSGPVFWSRRVAAAASLTVAFTALSGCGGSPLETFDLTAPASGIAQGSPRGQLAVSQPEATPPVDGDRIVVRTGTESVAFLSGAQWSDRLPRLVQTRLIQTFENGHSLGAVGRAGDRLTPNATLTSEIRRFEIDVTTGQAVVEISVKLITEGSGHVAKAKIFTVRAPGSATDGPQAAAALDAALGQTLRQIVAWTVGRG